ncbi:MAG: FAD:protein FMN transferase [Nitrospinaceae bacterium]|nr:MAG: FAD:protein FMN transferase [Nitrospinaceae bacterium]
MGTLVEISVREPDADKAQRAVDQAFDEMQRLEKLMSTHLADSEISRLNANAGEAEFIPVSQEVLEVIQRAIYWSNKTSGALDISVGPASRLWHFDNENPSLPDAERLAQAVPLINFHDIEIKASRVRLKQSGMSLHLGAIAKGFAVDRAIAVLKNLKIQHALINAGGDLKTLGNRDDGKPWRIGLQHPRQPEKMIASFALSGKAVATSGDYQKYFMLEGTRYHHILDPKSGMPARGMISATIVTDSVMDADALATAVFVLGPEKGMILVDSLNEVEAMLVLESGTVLFSKNFQSQSGFTFHTLQKDSIK